MNVKRRMKNEGSRHRVVRAFLGALALLAMAVCAAGCAQPAPDVDIVIAPAQGGKPAHITLAVGFRQGIFITPMPYWIREPNQVNDKIGYSESKGPIFVQEFIPKGQDYDHWTRLFGVYGFYLPGTSPEKFLEDTRKVFTMSCKRGGTLTPLVENERLTKSLVGQEHFDTFEYDCPEMNQKAMPTGGNTMEHGYLFVSHVKDSYVRLFLSWRGAGDNATQAPDWATNPELRKRILFNLRKTHFVARDAVE